MDVREKLVELLNKANSACVGTDCFEGCKFYMENDCLYKLMADVMIANGVTVQECGRWLSEGIAMMCNKCKKCLVVEQGDADMNYCPHCGAKMMPKPPNGGMCNE
jgi:DNA-directed RNA polymerase subunit RPC12/RpoP